MKAVIRSKFFKETCWKKRRAISWLNTLHCFTDAASLTWTMLSPSSSPDGPSAASFRSVTVLLYRRFLWIRATWLTLRCHTSCPMLRHRACSQEDTRNKTTASPLQNPTADTLQCLPTQCCCFYGTFMYLQVQNFMLLWIETKLIL